MDNVSVLFFILGFGGASGALGGTSKVAGF